MELTPKATPSMRGGGSFARLCDSKQLPFRMLTKYMDEDRVIAVMDLDLIWEW